MSVSVVLVVLCWLVKVLVTEEFPTLQSAARILLVVTVFGGAALLRRANWSPWNAPFILYVVLTLFHVGLYIQPAIDGGVPAQIAKIGHRWFLEYGSQAALIIALGLVSFVSGVVIVRPVAAMRRGQDSGLTTLRLVQLGSVVMTLGVVSWLRMIVTASGWGFYLLDYQTYLSSADGDSATVSFMLMTVAAPLLALSPRSRSAALGILSFILFVVLGFPLGLRGEVLMPLVAGICVYVSRPGRRPRAWTFWVGVLAVMVPITVVRQLRQVGLGGAGGKFEIGPLGAVEELGYTARVVMTVFEWHLFEPFKQGLTYVTPSIRHLRSAFGVAQVSGDADFGLMNVEIGTRVGTIGGSVIGEAYHNFGYFGVAIVLALFGFFVARAVSRVRSDVGLAFVGVVFSAFLQHVRNSFGPFVLTVAFGSLPILIAIVWAGGGLRRRGVLDSHFGRPVSRA